MKLISALSLLLIFFSCGILQAQTNAPDWIWAKDGHGKPEAMVKDVADNLYYFGNNLNDSVTIEGVKIPNSGMYGFFVVKYMPQGTMVWAKSYAADQLLISAASMNLDKAGNIYLSGAFLGTVILGNDTLVSEDGFESFLTKLDNNGEIVWTRTAMGAGDNIATKHSLGIDDSCNIYMAGEFTDSISFDSTQLLSDSNAIYIVKYDSAGKLQWGRSYSTGYMDHLRAVTADSMGNFYIAGDFYDSLQFEATVLHAGINSSVFIAKHDRDGNLLWAKNSMQASAGELVSVALDKTGNMLTTGMFSDAFIFAGNTIPSFSNRNIFLAKYDNSGNELWARLVTDSSAGVLETPYDVAADNNDNVYVAGTFNASNGITAKFSSAGTRLWLKNGAPGTPNMGTVNGVCVGALGNAYVLGRIPAGGMTLRKLDVFPLGIAGIEQETPSLRLYPNPANTILTISSKDAFEQVNIYDIAGKMVLSKKTAKTKEITIDIEGLVPGVYLLEAGDGVKTKFVKE